MTIIQILFLIPLCTFYIIYVAKMLMLRRQNIQGDILGKGEKPKDALIVEIILRITTYTGVAIQFVSVIFPRFIWSVPIVIPVRFIGVILGTIGCIFLLLSITTMKTNWRAGFSSKQNTKLVTNGIYNISRNPAFVGFDLLYIGCAMAFPNIINLFLTIFALIMFHIQILGEEKYLMHEFGEEYLLYKEGVARYI